LENKVRKIRILIPHNLSDSGIASGGFGPLIFPFNIFAILLTPWTWSQQLRDSAISRVQEQSKGERGEAPFGYVYQEFPETITLNELLQTFGYAPNQLWQNKYLGREIRDHGHQMIGKLDQRLITKAIENAWIASL
jgi:hypothetical protein